MIVLHYVHLSLFFKDKQTNLDISAIWCKYFLLDVLCILLIFVSLQILCTCYTCITKKDSSNIFAWFIYVVLKKGIYNQMLVA